MSLQLIENVARQQGYSKMQARQSAGRMQQEQTENRHLCVNACNVKQ